MPTCRLVALAGVALLAASCSAGAAQPHPTVTVTVTASPASPADTAPASRKLGAQVPFDDADSTGSAAVLKFQQPLPSRFPPERAGYEYAGIEVRRCFKTITASEGIAVGWSPWTLTYKNGNVVEPPSSWSADHFSVQLYPRDRPVRAGQCIRGWIPYEVPKRKRPATVAYILSGSEGTQQVEWSIG